MKSPGFEPVFGNSLNHLNIFHMLMIYVVICAVCITKSDPYELIGLIIVFWRDTISLYDEHFI